MGQHIHMGGSDNGNQSGGILDKKKTLHYNIIFFFQEK